MDHHVGMFTCVDTLPCY